MEDISEEEQRHKFKENSIKFQALLKNATLVNAAMREMRKLPQEQRTPLLFKECVIAEANSNGGAAHLIKTILQKVA